MKRLFSLPLVFAFILLILTGCSSEPRHTIAEWDIIQKQRLDSIGKEVQYKAKVLEMVSEEKQDQEGARESTLQVIKVRISNGPFKGEVVEAKNLVEADGVYNIEVSEGDQIFILPEFDSQANIINSYVTDIVRDRYLIIITVLFISILIIIGKLKGARAAITLAITAAAVLKVFLPLVLKGYNPIMLAVALGIVITMVTLLIISGFNRKTWSTIIGTSCGILIGGTLALIFGRLANLTGLSSEEARMLAFIPQEITFDYRGILFAGIILASLGAVMDVSMSISSSMYEIVRADPTIRRHDLISAGMNVGRDIIGTMSNTLILVYIGSSLPLMLLFMAYDLPFIELINKDIIASEVIRALSGSMGLIIAIPVTVFVSAGMFGIKYTRRRD